MQHSVASIYVLLSRCSIAAKLEIHTILTIPQIILLRRPWDVMTAKVKVDRIALVLYRYIERGYIQDTSQGSGGLSAPIEESSQANRGESAKKNPSSTSMTNYHQHLVKPCTSMSLFAAFALSLFSSLSLSLFFNQL